MYGVNGKYLDVDLSNEKTTDYEIPEKWYELFLGGRGIAARILAEELQGGEEPLGPENLLIFSVGPLQGTNLGGAGRHCVTAKSPKTNSISDSYAGGFFAHELALSGYDGIIIRGKSEIPVYLTLVDSEGEVEPADDLWGKTTYETESTLKKRYDGSKVSSIGPAGENQVTFSCIINDMGRAAGRPGFGAVMGSKNLKAVAVRGSEDKEYYDKEKFSEVRRDFAQKLTDEKGQEFGKYGTPGGVLGLNETGILPTENFRRGEFEQAEQISGEKLYEDYLVERDTCAGCPIRCKRVVKTEFLNEEVDGAGPEYETVAALGSLVLNDDLSAISLANKKCNEYGLDTISAGVTIAYAMEAHEKGYLDSPDNLDLTWGNAETIISIIDKMGKREGFGDFLAQGIESLEDKLGTNFAQQIKGQELPMHDPRGKKGFGLSYATSPRGATHVEGMHDTVFESNETAAELGFGDTYDRLALEDKAKLAKVYEDLMSFTNSAIMCRFTTFNRAGDRYNYPELREGLNAVTGRDIGPQEMLDIGERGLLLLKLLAFREGYQRKDDDLTDRLKSRLPSGGSKGEGIPQEDLETMKKEYYELRGLEEEGISKEKLNRLGLDDLAI
ncbi:aldehyde ferredoxin oxidoreductase family protein [Candidatus Bipolaricaulota bacterium]|nr:aldehyde ferredoxin oxidoreductase family protein [Candidatus Bipolaricaulota bacterium]